MIDHNPPPNWVVGRADCNLNMTFQALHEIVRRDVDTFNSLYERKRRGRTFGVSDHTDGCSPKFIVEQEVDSPKPPQVMFSLEPTAIRINGGGVQFFVRPRWDGERCRFSRNNEDGVYYEVWEISQAALENLFFGE